MVQGSGGLGVNACAVAAELGANKVIVIDGQKPRLDLALQCGATDTIDMNERYERWLTLRAGLDALADEV